MKLLSIRGVARHLGRRFFSPAQHVQFWRCLLTARKSSPKSARDAQLLFYSRILPGDFLNYGFFANPAIEPEDMSLNQIRDAQIRYAENMLELVPDQRAPVLDAGCGMGGLVTLAAARGLNITALTPNLAQAAFLRQKHPAVPLVEDKLENFRSAETFGTVITSESFQYMKMQPGFDAIKRVLRPGGAWILCDYFRISDAPGSGHSWKEFEGRSSASGWRITSNRDITQNVLPTLKYLHMWGRRVAVPLAELISERLKRKHPAGHHLLQDVLADLNSTLLLEMQKISPDAFVRERKYMLLSLQRAE